MTITCCLIFYYFIGFIVCAVIVAQHPVKDIKYYHHFVQGTLLQVFPTQIPNSAQQVKLIYIPRVLQGPTETTLYYIDKNLDINEFDKQYRTKAKWVGRKNEEEQKEELLESVFLNTPISGKNENHFTIYLIMGDCDNSGYCNHGNYFIAAMNSETKEVVFSSKKW